MNKVIIQEAAGPETWILPVFPGSLYNLQYNYYLRWIQKCTQRAHSTENKVETYQDHQDIQHRVYWKKGKLYDIFLRQSSSRVVAVSSFLWEKDQADLEQISFILNPDGTIQIAEIKEDFEKITVFQREKPFQFGVFSKRFFDSILKKQFTVPQISL